MPLVAHTEEEELFRDKFTLNPQEFDTISSSFQSARIREVTPCVMLCRIGVRERIKP